MVLYTSLCMKTVRLQNQVKSGEITHSRLCKRMRKKLCRLCIDLSKTSKSLRLLSSQINKVEQRYQTAYLTKGPTPYQTNSDSLQLPTIDNAFPFLFFFLGGRGVGVMVCIVCLQGKQEWVIKKQWRQRIGAATLWHLALT